MIVPVLWRTARPAISARSATSSQTRSPRGRRRGARGSRAAARRPVRPSRKRRDSRSRPGPRSVSLRREREADRDGDRPAPEPTPESSEPTDRPAVRRPDLSRGEDIPCRHRLDHRRRNEGGRERRVSAQLDLALRREPADRAGVSLANEKRGLRQTVLGGDRPLQILGKPFIERNDARRIAAEQTVGEGVDMVIVQAHGKLSLSLTIHFANRHVHSG